VASVNSMAFACGWILGLVTAGVTFLGTQILTELAQMQPRPAPALADRAELKRLERELGQAGFLVVADAVLDPLGRSAPR
jgi:hypothetical protein